MIRLGVWILLLTAITSAQAPAPVAVPAARFVGTWVGTQAWAIPNPPPGANNEQPVTLELQLVDTVKAREIQLDGSSIRVRAADAPPVRSQERLYALVAADGRD